MRTHARRYAIAGALLWAALALPPSRHVLEATISLHMLVQIPLLGLAGWLVAHALPRQATVVLAKCNAGGITGLVLVSLVGVAWMIPRLLDAALDEPGAALAKFATVPLLIGAPLALSWPRSGFVVRGVFLVEVIATAFRMGWLYLASPVQLCSNYPLNQQQQLGRMLLALGAAIVLMLGWRLLWGRVRVDAADS